MKWFAQGMLLIGVFLGGGETLCGADADDGGSRAEVEMQSPEALREKVREMDGVIAIRDRQIADLKRAFEEMTDSFRVRVLELERKDGTELLNVAIEARDEAVNRIDALIREREVLEAERDEVQQTAEKRYAALVAERDALQQRVVALEDEIDALKAEAGGSLTAQADNDAEVLRLQTALFNAQMANEKERFVLAYNLGTLYKTAGRYQQAESEYLKALTLNERDAALHYNLGILYDDHLRNTPKARHHYERFLQLAPNDRDAPQVVRWLADLK